LRNFSGYFGRKWSDTDNDGTYDTLEVETRYMQGRACSTRPASAAQGQSDGRQRESLSRQGRQDILRNEITTIDNALTKPWTVNRFYRRVVNNPIYEEYNCTEDNRWITIGDKLYLLDGEGYVMPIQKGSAAAGSEVSSEIFQAAAH